LLELQGPLCWRASGASWPRSTRERDIARARAEERDPTYLLQ
jgi:hypothetical protein